MTFYQALKREIVFQKPSSYLALTLYLMAVVFSLILGIQENAVMTKTLPVVLIFPALFFSLIYLNYLEFRKSKDGN